MNQTIICRQRKAEPRLTRTVNKHQSEERASNEKVTSNVQSNMKPWICFVKKKYSPACNGDVFYFSGVLWDIQSGPGQSGFGFFRHVNHQAVSNEKKDEDHDSHSANRDGKSPCKYWGTNGGVLEETVVVFLATHRKAVKSDQPNTKRRKERNIPAGKIIPPNGPPLMAMPIARPLMRLK